MQKPLDIHFGLHMKRQQLCSQIDTYLGNSVRHNTIGSKSYIKRIHKIQVRSFKDFQPWMDQNRKFLVKQQVPLKNLDATLKQFQPHFVHIFGRCKLFDAVHTVLSAPCVEVHIGARKNLKLHKGFYNFEISQGKIQSVQLYAL